MSQPGQPFEHDFDLWMPTLGSKVAILGYGRFGRALGQLALDSGLEVRAYDPIAEVPEPLVASSLAELVADVSEVIVAVPTVETRRALLSLEPHLTARHLVMDVGSVKYGAVQALTAVLGERVPWISTHPLFGSSAVALGERPLLTVICPNEFHPEVTSRARAFYEQIGCIVTEQDAAGHDRTMAHSHALAFFIAKGLIDMGAGNDLPFTPPSFQAMTRTIDMIRTDAAHLFLAVERENPYSAQARQELLDALSKVHNEWRH